MKNWQYKSIALIFWLTVWQLLAVLVDTDLILASPVATVKALMELVGTSVFWKAIGNSFLHIVAGFLLATGIGALLAWASYEVRLIREIVTPAMDIIKATPVASFVIVVLLWVHSAKLSIVISLLIVLPIVYRNLLEGFLQADSKLLEMAHVFRFSYGKKLRYIYLPSLRPYLLSAVSLGLGMCWKAGVAAEVIGLPKNSIGRELYDAKLYLMTPELFAWTIVIILVSATFEKLVTMLLRKAFGAPAGKQGVNTREE